MSDIDTDQEFVLPTTPDAPVVAVRKNRFPAVIQLGVLGFVLLALLGSAYIPTLRNPSAPSVAQTAILPGSDTKSDLAVMEPIGAVTIRAKSAYVYDVRAGRALYNKNADEVVPIASITKLMTALVAHELIADDADVTVPRAATMQSSVSGLLPGEAFTSEALSQYAMMSSSNDAAYSLAAAVGTVLTPKNDPVASFVTAMNIKAEELELDNLTFYNPTGLDRSVSEAGAYGTARDITFLMEYILTNYPDILAPTTDSVARVYSESGTYHDAENTNPIINRIPNLIGSKTGYTDLAGGNLTIAFDAGFDRPIIVTVLGSSFDERFTDVLTLVASVQEAMAKVE
jgi:serine-type D-Ala-D-Ala carboxypeptidase (penicillin-binding protein 5/6)